MHRVNPHRPILYQIHPYPEMFHSVPSMPRSMGSSPTAPHYTRIRTGNASCDCRQRPRLLIPAGHCDVMSVGVEGGKEHLIFWWLRDWRS
ncbi:hypothetical protein ACFX15_012808 [Malus domestica]